MNGMRRDACPSVADPMLTGDGLLARLAPPHPIPIDTFLALCKAIKEMGNGIVEVTQRGSLQIRGLSRNSAPLFARSVTEFGLGAQAGPPLLAPPLLELDPRECIALRELAVALRTELPNHVDAASIGPKVSVLIDGEGALHLDSIMADVRLRVRSAARCYLAIAGSAATATTIGWVEADRAVEVVGDLLSRIAQAGPGARARNIVERSGVHDLRASLANVLLDASPPPLRPPAEPLGIHELNDGTVACGFALAFGHVEVDALERFSRAAASCGAVSIRPAPDRTLLAIGLTAAAAHELTAIAAAAGFIVNPSDPRRYVVACAGAPACASATLSTRQLAPAIAQAARLLLDGSITLHVSGCAKGCAHPGAAALTLVGPDKIVVQGRAGDAPDGTISPAAFIAGLQRLRHADQLRSRLASHERTAGLLASLGAVPAADSTGAEAEG